MGMTNGMNYVPSQTPARSKLQGTNGKGQGAGTMGMASKSLSSGGAAKGGTKGGPPNGKSQLTHQKQPTKIVTEGGSPRMSKSGAKTKSTNLRASGRGS